MTRTHDLPIAPGGVLRKFSESEASQLAEAWLKVFGKKRRGINTKDYLWHVFSTASFPSISGVEAMEEYKKQTGLEFVVLSNDRKQAFVTDRFPDASPYSDFYVFPQNLAWTMAFTHEDGWLGPYFARHPDFATLDGENQAKLKKHREAELARQKGWT